MEEYTGEYASQGTELGVGGWAFAVSGYILALGKMAWDRFFSKEAKANDTLVQQLTNRIDTQEQKLRKLEEEIDHERRLRRLEQSRVHMLAMYIIELRAELRRHGIEVPTHASLSPDDLSELLGTKGDEDESTRLDEVSREP